MDVSVQSTKTARSRDVLRTLGDCHPGPCPSHQQWLGFFGMASWRFAWALAELCRQSAVLLRFAWLATTFLSDSLELLRQM